MIRRPEHRLLAQGIGRSDGALLRDAIDAQEYRRIHDDLGSDADAVLHYVMHGAAEGRDPTPDFSTSGYLARMPEARRSKANPLLHWLSEGRRARMSPLGQGAHALALASGRDPFEISERLSQRRAALRGSISDGPLSAQLARAAEIEPSIMDTLRVASRPVIPPFLPDDAAARTAASIRLIDMAGRRTVRVVAVCAQATLDGAAEHALREAGDEGLLIALSDAPAPRDLRTVRAGGVLEGLGEDAAARVVAETLRALRPETLIDAGSPVLRHALERHGRALRAAMAIAAPGTADRAQTPRPEASPAPEPPPLPAASPAIRPRPDLSVIVLAHDEGALLTMSLRAAEAACARAEAGGLTVERVLALDRPDAETREAASAWPGWRPEMTDKGEVGLARNAALARSAGRAVAWMDGDDLFGESFLAEAMATLETSSRSIVHPEINWVFRDQNLVFVHTAQDDPLFVPEHFYSANYYDALCLAPREAFEAHPQSARDPGAGLSYQDWQFAVESMDGGWRHVIAPGTVIFKRRRTGSRVVRSAAERALVRQPGAMAADRIAGLGR